jgi:FixJ family two-component response regulator
MRAATIFIVDDDLSVRRSLARLLMSAGYDVVACATAEEFLALDVARPACLVTDVRMPGMTGLDLLEALRSSGRDLPIILSSGDADAASAAQASARGAFRFVSKPFEPDELLGALEEAIDRDRSLIRQR